MIHTVKGFGIVNTEEIDVFLELFCFFDDPTGDGNVESDMTEQLSFSEHIHGKCWAG